MMFWAASVLFFRLRARFNMSSASFSCRLLWCWRIASSSAADCRSSTGMLLKNRGEEGRIISVFYIQTRHSIKNESMSNVVKSTFCVLDRNQMNLFMEDRERKMINNDVWIALWSNISEILVTMLTRIWTPLLKHRRDTSWLNLNMLYSFKKKSNLY